MEDRTRECLRNAEELVNSVNRGADPSHRFAYTDILRAAVLVAAAFVSELAKANKTFERFCS